MLMVLIAVGGLALAVKFTLWLVSGVNWRVVKVFVARVIRGRGRGGWVGDQLSVKGEAVQVAGPRSAIV